MSLSLSRCSRSIFRFYRQTAIPRPIPFAIVPTHTFSTKFPHYANKVTPSTTSHRSTSNPNFPPEGGLDPREVFSDLDVLSGLPTPASAVDAVLPDGFLLNNGLEIRGDGVFILHNDAFRWKAVIPSSGDDDGEASKKAKKSGVLRLDEEVWGLLDVVYPKPGTLFHLVKYGE